MIQSHVYFKLLNLADERGLLTDVLEQARRVLETHIRNFSVTIVLLKPEKKRETERDKDELKIASESLRSLGFVL